LPHAAALLAATTSGRARTVRSVNGRSVGNVAREAKPGAAPRYRPTSTAVRAGDRVAGARQQRSVAGELTFCGEHIGAGGFPAARDLHELQVVFIHVDDVLRRGQFLHRASPLIAAVTTSPVNADTPADETALKNRRAPPVVRRDAAYPEDVDRVAGSHR
jgi:hypothetical protein